jgi:hypothetical protein
VRWCSCGGGCRCLGVGDCPGDGELVLLCWCQCAWKRGHEQRVVRAGVQSCGDFCSIPRSRTLPPSWQLPRNLPWSRGTPHARWCRPGQAHRWLWYAIILMYWGDEERGEGGGGRGTEQRREGDIWGDGGGKGEEEGFPSPRWSR